MNTQDIAYYRRRERKEREMAARARDSSARRAHLEMADRYHAILGVNTRLTGAGMVRIVVNAN